MAMKNSNDTIGNRTRDLPTCSPEPQPTAPPRIPNRNEYQGYLLAFKGGQCVGYLLAFKGGQCVGLTTLPLSCADFKLKKNSKRVAIDPNKNLINPITK